MRLRLAAIAVLLCCAPARGDIVTISFGSLDGRSGQSITSYDSGGFRVQDVDGMTIVGSASSAYLGKTGLVPVADPATGGELEIFMPAGYPADFRLNSVSIAVGPADGVSQDIDIQGIAHSAVNGPVAVQEWRQTIAGITTLDFPVDQRANLVTFEAVNASAFAFAQVTGVTIDFTPEPPEVPEPSGLALLGIGCAFAIRRRPASC